MEMCDLHCGQYLGNGDLSLPPQGRTQDRADGAKAPPEILRKKIIYSFKSGAFYVSQFLHPLADYVPPIQLIN